MRNARRAVGLLLGLVLAGFGCGEGGGTVIPLTDPTPTGPPPSGGGGGPTTSVDPGKRFDELTPGERTQLCNDLTNFITSSDFAENICRFNGWLSASLQAEIDPTLSDSDLRAVCEAEALNCPGPTTGTCNPPVCAATVGEFNACLADTAQAFAGIPACSAVTRASLANPPLPTTTSTACMAFETKCPDEGTPARAMSSLSGAGR